MSWADANFKGFGYSRALKRVLTKYKGNLNKMGLRRGFRPAVGLVIGDTSPTGHVTAEEGSVIVRYASAGNMPATAAAVYMNTDGSTTWVDVST